MLAKLFLLFTIVPIIELFVLIPLGSQIGVWPTVGIIVATGLVGALLGKRQGIGTLRKIRSEMSRGKLPGDSILDGLIVLVACTLLVTPGVLTDIVGITMLLPPARKPVKGYLKSRFTKMLHNPSVTVIDLDPFRSSARPGRIEDPDVIDVTPQDEKPAGSSDREASVW